jgi:malonyl-CoA decarboxylase
MHVDGEWRAAQCAIDRCHDLLSVRGDVSGESLAASALTAYQSLSPLALNGFFDLLARWFGPDEHAVRRCSRAYLDDPSAQHLQDLQRAVEPPRRELFRRLNTAPRGTAALIDMRHRLMCASPENPSWAVVAADLAHLFQSWFNGGFLELRRIDWHTPPPVLEWLIRHEAVHQICDWHDLRRRLQPDRRCYALFHPALPDEPLIFTELAFTRGLGGNVQPLVDPETPLIDPETCDTALFYSISNCHPGLRGISFGNVLIRRVVDHLAREYPGLSAFATVSPIPGFRSWLTAAVRSGGAGSRLAALVAELDATGWHLDADRSATLGRALVPLCALYLLQAKRGPEPDDPVARFHLGNGARLERLNWLGDPTPAGIRRSASVTANYVYRLADVERNHDAYVASGTVTASPRVEEECLKAQVCSLKAEG